MPTRDMKLNFRVSEQEATHLRTGAADAGMKLSAYLREAVLGRSVVVIAGSGLVIVPAANGSDEHERAVHGILQGALDEATAKLAGGVASPSEPRSAPPAPTSPQSASASRSAAAGKTTPPGRDGGAVGSDPPSGVDLQAPAPEESLEPGGAAACPKCGVPGGAHQGWCEEVRGEPPVDGTDRERAVEPENAQLFESYADFLARRTTELVVAGRSYAVARAEADAEWTATINRGAKVTAPKEIVCSVCGAARLSPSTPCPDCGNH